MLFFSKLPKTKVLAQFLLLTSIVSTGQAALANNCSQDEKEVKSYFGIETSDIYVFLKEFMSSRSEIQRSESRIKFIKSAAAAIKTGKFNETIDQFLREKTQLPEKQRAEIIKAFNDAVGLEIGRITSKYPNRTWRETSDILLRELQNSGNSKVGTESFERELSNLVGSKFTEMNNARVLRNGPQSFGMRDKLFKNAKKSIWVAAWAVYADFTGKQAVDLLIKKHREGVDVRVIVDGNNSFKTFAKGEVDRLVAAGVPVIRWRLDGEAHFGMHRKFMVIDGQYSICGGMNFGNEYSHRTVSDPHHRWRDVDMYHEGPSAVASSALFTKAWNHYARLTGKVAEMREIAAPTRNARGRDRLMIVDHEPTRQMTRDPIYLATLKLIDGAKGTIDISNAYYIETPAIREVLLKVLRDKGRNVRVRFHTNSADSVNHDTLIRPIYRGLKELIDAGAEVYLHKGTTSHGKYMLVDGHMGWIGSYNLHPRSHKFESETVALFDSYRLGQELLTVFERDLGSSKKVTDSSKVDLSENALADFAEALFFDQL